MTENETSPTNSALFASPRPGVFEHLYARLGDRYLTFLLVGAALSIPGLGLITTAFAMPYLEASMDVFVRSLVFVGPWLLAVGVVAELVNARVLGPLREWIREGRPAERALNAWHAAIVRLPRAVLIGTVAVAVAAVPAELYVLALVQDLSFVLVAGTIVGVTIFVLAGGILHVLVWEQVLKPIVLELAGQLPRDFGVPRESISLSTRLIMVIPIMNVLTAFAASVAGGAEVDPGLRVALGIGVAAAVSACVALPLTVMLRRSLLGPMDRLLGAMGRAEHGDLDARLPFLSADELGTIAQHFNSMLDGLKERERLSGENVRLEAKVHEQLEEVLASRARIIAASDAERRRVERNLHDGAQQRLVALALELRLLEQQAGKVNSDDLRAGIARANDNLSEALAELKELARGLHPQILTTDGLRPALRQLASRAPVPVEVTAPAERYPEAVESTAYFVVSEALANVAKYSRASRADVQLTRRDGKLAVAVEDDGVGGADASAGSGLAGLADRVAALEGTLTVHSEPGSGTTVRAELPLS